MRRLSSLLWWIPGLWAIAFSLKSLREPDLWWQIRTGQQILQDGHVPMTDSFSYTRFGQEWINIKWGFEVVAALLASISPEVVLLLQTMTSLLMLWVLFRFLRLMDLHSAPLFFVSAALLLFGMEYRTTGRPEMMTHLMAFSFWYLLMRFRKEGSLWVFLLILLQILWTNWHEAYGMGPIVVGIFLVGTWWEEKQFSQKVKILSGVWVGTVLAILVNPRGLTLLTRPMSIFSQVQENKYTTELSAFYTADFWQKESIFFVVLVLALLVFLFRNGKNTVQEFLRDWGMGSMLLGAAWSILGMMAYRNMVFPYLFLTMVVAWILWRRTNIKTMKPLPLVIVGMVFYGLIVSNTYYSWVGSRDTYGLQVMGKNNPMGAANYLTSKGLDKQHGMADYLSSSYLLWRLQPNFKTYIDLRDLDVFTTENFAHYLQVMNNTDSFYAEDQKQAWRYVVLYRNSHPNLHAYLYNDSVYACTYVDPVCAVYEKTDDFQRGDIFSLPAYQEPSALATGISILFNWAYKPYDPSEDNVDYSAADYFYTVGLVSAAEKRINAWRNVYSSPEADSLYLRILELKQHIKR